MNEHDVMWFFLLIFALWHIEAGHRANQSDKKIALLEARIEEMEGNQDVQPEEDRPTQAAGEFLLRGVRQSDSR